MQYTIDVWKNGKRLNTTTDVLDDDLKDEDASYVVTDNMTNRFIDMDWKEFASWRMSFLYGARDLFKMQKSDNDAINPSHYKNYCGNLQWIEAMSLLPTFSDPRVFEGALELQVRKYLDRNGQKDASLQELEKALWYLKALVAYKKSGKLVVKDIDKTLSN